MFQLGTSLAKPAYSRSLLGSRAPKSFSFQKTSQPSAQFRRSYSSKKPDSDSTQDQSPNDLPELDPIRKRRLELREEKKRKVQFKQVAQARFDAESQDQTRFQNAELFSEASVFKSTVFPGPARESNIHLIDDLPGLNRPFHADDLARDEKKIFDENRARLDAFRALQEMNNSYRELASKTSKDGELNQLDLPAELMQQFSLPPGSLDANFDMNSLTDEHLSQMNISNEQLEELLPLFQKLAKFNTESSPLMKKVGDFMRLVNGPRGEVVEVAPEQTQDAQGKINTEGAEDVPEAVEEAEEEAAKSDEADEEAALEGEAREGADLELDHYQLSSGNYIDAQNFLQDVSHFKVSDFSMEKRTRVVEMIERARKILRSQKQDRLFWDEFVALRQMNELTLLNDSHYRPVVHPNMKDNMYYLHMSNPQEWTVGKLAQKFRMLKVKVEAILKLKIDEHIKLRTAPWLVSEEGDEIDEAYADYFGWVAVDEWSVREADYRMDVTSPRWRSAMVSVADEEEDLAALHRANFRVQERWDEMPEKRPTSGPGAVENCLDGALIRRPQYKYLRRPRSEHIWIDSSPVENFDENSKMFWVAKDGSMRHLTWSERVLVCKRGNFGENQFRGDLANLKTLLDPIVFPADKEEEALLKEQQKPLWKNRRYSQATVITEKDILKKMDHAFGRIGPINIPMTSYTHGRIPYSVQEAMKTMRKTNVLDTIYKPHVLLDL